mmetsp:Transcript_22422/g.51681  ORF Transcript_22422/g.51681 Transcript_22422/m.51681 type:complete len:112 (+) Transcript_22422:165-500(+)
MVLLQRSLSFQTEYVSATTISNRFQFMSFQSRKISNLFLLLLQLLTESGKHCHSWSVGYFTKLLLLLVVTGFCHTLYIEDNKCEPNPPFYMAAARSLASRGMSILPVWNLK